MKNQNVLQFNGLTLRRIIFFLALIGMGNLYSYQLNAQIGCDQAFTARDSSIISPVNQQASMNGITYIKLYFHIYHAFQNGSPVGVDMQRCRDMRDLLNDQFDGSGFQFFFNECEVDSIHDNYRAVVADSEVLHEIPDAFFCNRNHVDGIDIHVRPDLQESFAAAAQAIGGGEFVIGGFRFLNLGSPLSLSGTLAHEMGHCLGLFHTFQGTCSSDPNSVQPNCMGETIILPDPSDGDLVDDTPEDGNGNIIPGSDCTYSGNPACGDPGESFNPMTENFMAYYGFRELNCQREFTQGQIDKMHRDALHSIRYDNPNSHSLTVERQGSSCSNTLVAKVECDQNELDYIWSNSETDSSITISGSGTYWVEVSDENGNVSKVEIVVVDNTEGPDLSATEIIYDCPDESINLNDYFLGDVPTGLDLVWSNSTTPPSGGGWDPVDIPLSSVPNDYFAFFYNPVSDCYSASSKITVRPSYSAASYETSSDVLIENDVVLSLVKVADNTTFTIRNCTVELFSDSKFYIRPNAKLILDNATITNFKGCEDEAKPEGIFLIPDAAHLGLGQIEMKNGSIIENMERGIVTAWDGPDQNDRIIINNSTIQNCDIGLHVRTFGTSSKVSSSISNNSKFVNNRRGIYYNGASGLVVEGSDFLNHQEAGIVLTDGEAIIKGGNKFDGGFAGIWMDATSPMTTNVVIGDMGGNKNVITNIDYVILINGAYGSMASVYMENNEISVKSTSLASTAFMAWGVNSYYFRNNEVKSGILRSFNSGSEFNRISCNDIASNIRYSGGNSNSDFLENDISGSNPVSMYDLSLPLRPTRENIGMTNEAAGNCFQGSNKDILNFGPSFNYYYYFDEPCEEPDDPNLSYNDQPLLAEAGRCDGRGLFNLIDPDADGIVGLDSFNTTNHISESAVLDSINHWIQTVISLGGDDIRTMLVEGYSPISPQLDQANEMLNQWLSYSLYRAEHEESTFAHQIFQLTGSYEWQTREFGYRVNEGDLFTADTILQSLPTADSNQQVLYDTQVLNLKRLEIEDSLTANNYNVFSEDSLRVLYFDVDCAVAHGRPYFTETDVASIESMGETLTPSAAYARTLYYQLTGNHIDIPSIESGDESSELLLGAEDVIREGINIYPNPFSEEITVSMDEPISAISIFGLNGELVQEVKSNNAKVSLQANELLPGMYFLQIQTASGLKTFKVIKQ